MNNKISLLAAIYDNTFQRLETKIVGNKKNYNDPLVKDEVNYLSLVAETLINVLKIERARVPNSGNSETTSEVPEEKKQPDIIPDNSPPPPPKFGEGDFSNFHSPGGWDPN
jgi:hypothetical protein